MKKPAAIFYLNHTARLSGGEIALARALADLDRALVTPIVILAEDGPLVGRLTQIGIETHVLPLSSDVREVRKDSLGISAAARIRGMIHLFTYARTIARLARTRRVSAFHTNSLKADIYGAIAGRLARIPVIWHVRDHIDPSYLPAPAVLLFRLLARIFPAFVVSNSRSTEKCLHLPDAARKAVVYDGLGADELAELGSAIKTPAEMASETAKGGELAGRQRSLDPFGKDAGFGASGNNAAPVCIGIIGRLARWKGQHVFLEAAARLLASGCRARFIIIGSPLFGEDDYAASLHRQADALGISGSVEFQGFRADMPAALRQLDILIHASIIPEPFGQVVIEGMAAGLPVIATDGGGVKEIIQPGENGILVPMADPSALADAITGLMADPAQARRLAEAGRIHVCQNFTSALTARHLEAVYQTLLRKPKTFSSWLLRRKRQPNPGC